MKSTKDFWVQKSQGKKIVMVTAYDYPSAKQVEQAQADVILVGDSLGNVVLGYDSTIYVTMEDMLHHAKAVKRGAPNTFIVVDMPFMSYHLSVRDTLINGARLIQETGAHAVKLEGADDVLPHIKALVKAGIPVVSHLGLTPQSAAVLGGFKVQGKDAEAARKMLADVKLCQEAGAFAMVLECIPQQLAKEISMSLAIPTIGIGAGVHTDGQVLVYHDILTYGVNRVAKFVKAYTNVDEQMTNALREYVSEVRSELFPNDQHSFTMKEEELKTLYGGRE
ncbi:3-methyl-2-oxobutanoate hydroxymethyltransferase [Desulfosporosinus hippei]|uniref:3-methyl-2-oxobutanoate hydroxymethyltransferase n=1 Tax=Desulfosporosinus hippei DSM 8344 TaxID=1121419 RepID=A0A1G8FAM9_9FIRM|nr:3-methyl-2-oxobutanoate hydroxymethyltransferase [Desulfosporosinus hippei]SDH79158.1 3-methyl-2-oxobutanoate hydroxymethyltransferase [Desulfosporosinus hippei DSM 8344]